MSLAQVFLEGFAFSQNFHFSPVLSALLNENWPREIDIQADRILQLLMEYPDVVKSEDDEGLKVHLSRQGEVGELCATVIIKATLPIIDITWEYAINPTERCLVYRPVINWIDITSNPAEFAYQLMDEICAKLGAEYRTCVSTEEIHAWKQVPQLRGEDDKWKESLYYSSSYDTEDAPIVWCTRTEYLELMTSQLAQMAEDLGIPLTLA